MESLGQVLQKIVKNQVPSPNTDECWCAGKGGIEVRYIPSFGEHKEAIAVFGKTCICPAGLTEAQRKKDLTDQYNESQHRKVMQLRWQHSSIPSRFQTFRLATSPLLASHSALIHRLNVPPDDDLIGGSTWADFSGSWYFYGTHGVGKTGLAVSYAREISSCLDDVENVLFVSLPKLLGELRSTYNRRADDKTPTEQDIITKYAAATVLILDDLGAEQVTGTGWVEDRLYQIIGDRHDEEKQTIFTSNLSLAQLAKRIGERITWRILEMCSPSRIVAIKGPNLRAVPPT